MRLRLVSAESGEPIDLPETLFVVGRGEECDLPLGHPSISKQHCILWATSIVVHLRDLGSRNGTRVNGKRVRRAVLMPKDEVSFAGLEYRVETDTVKKPKASPDRTIIIPATDLPDGESSSADFSIDPVRFNDLPDSYD